LICDPPIIVDIFQSIHILHSAYIFFFDDLNFLYAVNLESKCRWKRSIQR